MRSPSAPAEAAYTIPTYDSSASLHLSDSPSTPSSSSSHSSHSPQRPPARSRADAPQTAKEPPGEGPVSRSGRRIKRKFDLSALGGARRVKKVSVGSEAEAGRPSSRARQARSGSAETEGEGGAGRAWERAKVDDADESEEEEEEEEEEEQEADRDVEGVAQQRVYGVAYRH